MQGEKTVTTQIASECQIIPRLDDLVTVIKQANYMNQVIIPIHSLS